MLTVLQLLEIGTKLIDKLVPDPEAKQKAQVTLLELQQRGELKEIEAAMNAIMAEANSNDPWTSRARPTFLYVVYVMILASIPMGVLFAVDPETAANIAAGMANWLGAIPEEVWWLFGAGYLGYTGARTLDKRRMSK